jgi:transcriptional regulator with XRE-family HTH domain
MNTPLERMRAEELGERLRGARESARITQEAAASSLKIARTTLIAIEKGERRVRINELQQLAKLYGSSVNTLLRQEAVFVDLVPRFRKLSASKEDTVSEAAQLLADLIKAEVELENLLGIQRARRYPPERRIMPGDVRVQAEQDAQELGLVPRPEYGQ